MKKAIIFVFAFICIASTTLAASLDSQTTKIAVVIVGGSDFKTVNFVRYAREFFEEANTNGNLIIFSGDEIQSKYQDYWLDKGLLEEGTPVKQDLLDFVNYSGYDKVIYLMVKDPVVDTHERGRSIFRKQNSRASITVNAYLVDRENIIKTATSTKENDSDRSELRAKRGAFKQCVRAISEVFNPLLK